MEKVFGELNIYGKLIHGVYKDGSLVTVDEVEGQMACECTCPYCHRPLTAKKGDIREHHFAHLPNQTCNYHNKISALMFAIKRVLQGTAIKINASKTITIDKLIDNQTNHSLSCRDCDIDTDCGKMKLFILLRKDSIARDLINHMIQETGRDGLVIDLSKEYNSAELTEKALNKLITDDTYKTTFIPYKKETQVIFDPATGRPLRHPLTDYQILNCKSKEKKTLFEWGERLNPGQTYLYKFAGGGTFEIQDPIGQFKNTGHIMALRMTDENSGFEIDMADSANNQDWMLIREVNR